MQFDIKKFDAKRLIKFEHNVGPKDKQVRIVAGAVLLFVSLFLANILMLLVGLVLVATGYFGWCPGYSGFCTSSLPADAALEIETADNAADADGQ
jgi:hypothetical protein